MVIFKTVTARKTIDTMRFQLVSGHSEHPRSRQGSHVHPRYAHRQSYSGSRTSPPRWQGRLERHAHRTRRGRSLASPPSDAPRQELLDDMLKSPGRPRIEEKDAAEPIRSCGAEPRLAHGPPHGRHLRARPAPKRARSEHERDEEPAPLKCMLRFERGSGERGPPSSQMLCARTCTRKRRQPGGQPKKRAP